VPGFGWVRAVTFYAYLDTPDRFANRSKLWRYCGIGLEKRGSGQGPMRTRLCRQGNRPLKGTLIGAAQSVITGDSPYAQRYRRWIESGLPPSTARRNVARLLATTQWTLWMEGERYDPSRVDPANAN
jgi:transposase